MKPLVESLFDKDLVEKDIPTFGDYYRVKGVYIIDGDYKNDDQRHTDRDYEWLTNTIKTSLLKKNFPTPIKINSDIHFDHEMTKRFDARVAGKKFCDDIGYFIAAINNIPYICTKEESNRFPYIGGFIKEAYNILSQYFKNLKGDNMLGRGGNYYFGEPNGLKENIITFSFWRKDIQCTIAFEEI